ncbi:aldo/keto reductase [Spiroplasma sabaudiense Ar-1343]|uniref:Aldo/keto reductase n=1 Tax=Spiroplasma sabaudiense Ar-1343 TaxID=1276257 RepID=W6AIT9_9MOLU|nr:aldo/keto reductase [Spiroplasma sabaudiense]AHI53624.1 aldo/keto reductase [Spiroplasma sabaudiense Ar-1343]
MNKILKNDIILNNGVKMPQIGLGTYKMTDETITKDAIIFALKLGYRNLDTAQIYKNHKIVAQAIKESGIPRNEIFITSKIWITDFRDAKIAFQRILDELEIEYLDLCLLHWFAPNWRDAYLVLEEEYKNKRIHAIGVSNFLEEHLEELLTTTSVIPAVNQVELHPQLPCVALTDYCQKKGIAITSWQTIMRGEIDKVPYIQEISKKYNATPAQVALKWAWQRGIIIIPKSVTFSRIEENANLGFFELTEEEIKKINDLGPELRLGPNPNNWEEL